MPRRLALLVLAFGLGACAAEGFPAPEVVITIKSTSRLIRRHDGVRVHLETSDPLTLEIGAPKKSAMPCSVASSSSARGSVARVVAIAPFTSEDGLAMSTRASSDPTRSCFDASTQPAAVIATRASDEAASAAQAPAIFGAESSKPLLFAWIFSVAVSAASANDSVEGLGSASIATSSRGEVAAAMCPAPSAA